MSLFRPKWKHPDSFVRLEAANKITAQKKLVKIALNDTDAEVRMAAAARLADKTLAQNVFCDIAMTASICAVRLAAAERLVDKALAQTMFFNTAKNNISDDTTALSKITDQTLLVDIAKNSSRSTLRIAAAERITDKVISQSVFFDISQHDVSEEVKTEAALKLTDNAMLASLAISTSSENVRLAAFQMIQDQSVLADIAKMPGASLSAVEMIFDQTALADVAQKAHNGAIRLAAAIKITDTALAQTIFADIAEGCQCPLRYEAVRLLTDQSLLAYVAMKVNDTKARLQVAEKLTNKAIAQNIFAGIAMSDDNIYVRLQVAEKLSDKALAQKIFADIAKKDWSYAEAAKKLTDQAQLADVAMRAESTNVRLRVAEKLADKALAQRIYADIAMKDKPPSEAAKKLTDQSLLADVAMLADSINVRLHVTEKLANKALAQRIYADISIAEPWGHETPSFDGDYYTEGYGETAFRKLTDIKLLGEVATTAKHEKVRRAAANKVASGNTSKD